MEGHDGNWEDWLRFRNIFAEWNCELVSEFTSEVVPQAKIEHTGNVVCEEHGTAQAIWKVELNHLGTLTVPTSEVPEIHGGFREAASSSSPGQREYEWRRDLPGFTYRDSTLFPIDYCAHGYDHEVHQTANIGLYTRVRANWVPGTSVKGLFPEYPVDGTCFPQQVDGARLLTHTVPEGWFKCHWCTKDECNTCICGLREAS